jgi:hypothetical protein
MLAHRIFRTSRAPRSVLAAVAAVVLLAAGIGVGSLVYAGATTTTTTFYACLKNATLSGVNLTAPPACKGGIQVMWNEQGPAGANGIDGNTIISGTTDPTTQGVDGDYYLNTTTYVLFGPKTSSGWGTGKSLVGPPADAGELTIHSSSFAPFMRMWDGDALQHAHYAGDDGIGPGSSPNAFRYIGGTGHDAFFNTPDLTIGSTPMSAVSAEVCYSFTKVNYWASADAFLGVQDGDREFSLAYQPLEPTDGQQACVTLAFENPVKLTNHPHLVFVLDLRLKSADDSFDADGVTYTLAPTAPGDIDPGS